MEYDDVDASDQLAWASTESWEDGTQAVRTGSVVGGVKIHHTGYRIWDKNDALAARQGVGFSSAGLDVDESPGEDLTPQEMSQDPEDQVVDGGNPIDGAWDRLRAILTKASKFLLLSGAGMVIDLVDRLVGLGEETARSVNECLRALDTWDDPKKVRKIYAALLRVEVMDLLASVGRVRGLRGSTTLTWVSEVHEAVLDLVRSRLANLYPQGDGPVKTAEVDAQLVAFEVMAWNQRAEIKSREDGNMSWFAGRMDRWEAEQRATDTPWNADHVGKFDAYVPPDCEYWHSWSSVTWKETFLSLFPDTVREMGGALVKVNTRKKCGKAKNQTHRLETWHAPPKALVAELRRRLQSTLGLDTDRKATMRECHLKIKAMKAEAEAVVRGLVETHRVSPKEIMDACVWTHAVNTEAKCLREGKSPWWKSWFALMDWCSGKYEPSLKGTMGALTWLGCGLGDNSTEENPRGENPMGKAWAILLSAENAEKQWTTLQDLLKTLRKALPTAYILLGEGKKAQKVMLDHWRMPTHRYVEVVVTTLVPPDQG